jgi:hypothetical protein
VLHLVRSGLKARPALANRARIISDFRRRTVLGTLARKRFARALKNLRAGIYKISLMNFRGARVKLFRWKSNCQTQVSVAVWLGFMLNFVRAWILLSAFLVSTGWILSVFHALDRIGYLAAFTLAGIVLAGWWRKNKWPAPIFLDRAGHKLRRRFQRSAPLLFLALALMSLVGGALYVSSNGDTDAYRTPRVLHWLGQQRWHWIHAYDCRINIVACGFEWLSAPLILFTRTDRLLFLINVVSYLMLPGLIFSVFTRLQVKPRVAWWWMWFLASGWCFVFQAGSKLNDSFSAIYALAAVDLALRARQNKQVTDLWLSMLAAALATGTKQTNIPLGLLWLIAAWPGFRLLLARPVATAMVAAISLLVSVVPVTISNIQHCGNWQGVAPGDRVTVWNGGSPFWRFVGNLFSIPIQNLRPPLLPEAGRWNEAMGRFLQTSFGAHFAGCERFGYLYAGVSEKNAGIGLGICILTFASIVGASWVKRTVPAGGTGTGHSSPWLLWVTPWALLFVYMTEICSFEDSRLLASYYIFLFPWLLARPGQAGLARRWWWQQLGLLLMLFSMAILVISRDRPLFPAKTVIARLQMKYPRSGFLQRLWLSYTWVISNDSRRQYFQKDFPTDEQTIGYATRGGDSEPGLWLPFGQRRVEQVLLEDTPEQLRLQNIHYVLVEDMALETTPMTIEQWMKRYDGDLIDQLEFMRDPYRPPGHLYLVRLRPDGKTQAQQP